MKRVALIAATAVLGVGLTAIPAQARPVKSPAPTTTVISNVLCGPSQFATSWTGADPSTVTLAYRKADGVIGSLFTVALNRDQKSTNWLVLNMTQSQRTAVKTIQGTPDNAIWYWSAVTGSGTVVSGQFFCKYETGGVIIVQS